MIHFSGAIELAASSSSCDMLLSGDDAADTVLAVEAVFDVDDDDDDGPDIAGDAVPEVEGRLCLAAAADAATDVEAAGAFRLLRPAGMLFTFRSDSSTVMFSGLSMRW